MEKTIIFLPIIIFFGFFFLLMIGFLLMVLKLVKKGRDSAWRGVVIDKLHFQKRDSDSKRMNHFFTLVFKTDEGKEIKVGVSQIEYNQWQIKDKAEKKKGEFKPKKI